MIAGKNMTVAVSEGNATLIIIQDLNVTWLIAEDRCSAQNMTLLSLATTADLDKVAGLVSNYSCIEGDIALAQNLT
jgi:hypothetical protein